MQIETGLELPNCPSSRSFRLLTDIFNIIETPFITPSDQIRVVVVQTVSEGVRRLTKIKRRLKPTEKNREFWPVFAVSNEFPRKWLDLEASHLGLVTKEIAPETSVAYRDAAIILSRGRESEG
jgi:hypothetical protein